MRKWTIRIFLIITTLESLLVAGIIYGQRSSKGEYFLNTGFTTKNFLLFVSAVFITILVMGIFYIFQKDERNFSRLTGILDNDNWFLGLVFVSLLILVECVQNLIFLSSNIKSPHYSNYLQLLFSIMPYLVFGVLFSIQFLLLIIILRSKNNPLSHLIKSIELPLIIIFIGITSVFVLFEQSKYGFIPYSTRYEVILKYGRLVPTNAPIIGEQVFIIFVLLMASVLMIQFISKEWDNTKKSKYFEWLLLISIWVITYLLWTNVPLKDNYFTYVSGPPNNTVYPISDAFYFDREAFSLINNGEFLPTTTHVLYSFFLAILHQLRGPEFIDIIGIQIAVLALTPVLLFKLTSKIHTKYSGVLVAILFIVRERNGLMLSNVLNGTFVNMLMTESFAVLGIVGFLYLFIDWLKQNENRKWIPILAGSVIGASLLIRAELLVILITASICALFYLWKDKKRWFYGMIQIWVAAGLIIIPWMTRNYLKSGIFTLDKGNYVQTRVMDYIVNIPSLFNNEKQEEFVIQNPELLSYTSELERIPNQFISSTLQSILYLPSSHQPLFTFQSIAPKVFKNYQNVRGFFSEQYVERYVRSLPYFANYWDGGIEIRSVFSIGTVLLFISIGIWYTWKHNSSIVLILPLAFISHIFLWAAAGFSGGRFIKPSDWITMVFYGIGLTEFSFFFLKKMNILRDEIPMLLSENSLEAKTQYKQKFPWFVMISSVLMIIFGLAPIFSEMILPAKYNERAIESTLTIISQMDQEDYMPLKQCYIDEINSSSSSIIYGKAVYPRYFEMGETLNDDRGTSLPDSSYSRLEFYIIGQQNIWAALPLDEPLEPFSHYSDVIVLGEILHENENDIEVRYWPYFRADSIYTIDLSDQGGTINKISNAGSECD